MKLLYHVRSLPDRTYDRILFSCGLFLLLTECYKQCFLYFIIDKRHYDWWFFPFQLCSLPMYLCLLLPFLKHKSMKTAVCTFLQDFNLLGGLAALIVSEGFRGIHWTLTLHGYIWHLLLVFIGLFVFAGRRSDLCRHGFPSSSRSTSISSSPKPRKPVPNTFETASFTAKSPASRDTFPPACRVAFTSRVEFER